MGPAVGLAACFLVLAFWLLCLSGGQQTLYAQVTDALRRAQTVHVLAETLQDAELEKGYEIWCDRRLGVRMTAWRGGETVFEIVDDLDRSAV